MVKLLRRGMKDMQARANEFVAAACKFEKEVGQQVGAGRGGGGEVGGGDHPGGCLPRWAPPTISSANNPRPMPHCLPPPPLPPLPHTHAHMRTHPQVESVRLSSESDKRTMQVELATARKEAAGAAALLKNALANWQVRGARCRGVYHTGWGAEGVRVTRCWAGGVCGEQCVPYQPPCTVLQCMLLILSPSKLPVPPLVARPPACCNLCLPLLCSACRPPSACLPTAAAQGELDFHKGEANRLRREMARVEGERERLREEARQ